jgi:glycosyltransferase involved in cell wall biosynthesis
VRILHLITRSESGGAQAVVAGLATELLKLGYEVAIGSGEEGGGEAWSGLDSRIELFEINGLGRSMSPLSDLAAFGSIRRLYRQWNPDIVHLHTSKAATLGRLTNLLPVSRIVYTMHGYGQLHREHRLFLPIDKFLAKRTGAVVAVSKNDLAAMSADGYRPVFIANGVSDARFLPHGDDEVIRRLRSLKSDGRKVALLIARDAAPKRIDIARAAAVLLEGRAIIVWIGGAPRCSDPSGFVALGRLPNAARYLAYADMVLLPSDHEGMPMSVLEGFSAGLPAVVSAVSGCLEAVGLETAGESDRGIAVANTPAAFAEAVLRLARGAEDIARKRKAARETWEREYTLAGMAREYARLYSRIA